MRHGERAMKALWLEQALERRVKLTGGGFDEHADIKPAHLQTPSSKLTQFIPL
jgi:hypothetical protein